MDDIVARLRKNTRTPYGLPVQSDEARLHVAAADEITRLRADLAAARALLKEARWSVEQCRLLKLLARIDAALKGDASD